MRPSVFLGVAMAFGAAAGAAGAGGDGTWEGKDAAQWRAVLTGRKDEDRARAAAALAHIGKPAKDALPDLAVLVGSRKDENLRVNAALALGKIGGTGGGSPWGEGLPPGLEGFLPEPDGEGVPGGGDGPPAKEPAPAARTPEEVELSALVRKKVVPALVRALRDPCVDVRTNAARSLSLLGEDAVEAEAALLKAAKEKADAVRNNALYALGRIPVAVDRLLPVLREALGSGDPTSAGIAARDLEALGKDALPALPELRAAILEDLKHPRTMSGFGDRSLPVKGIPGAEGFDRSPTLATNYCLVLAAIGREAAPALPEAIRVLKESKNVPNRSGALQAIGAIRARPDDSVPALTAALEDPSDHIRGYAALVLARFGPDARPALPALEKLRDGSEGVLRQNARYAIDRIAGTAVATGEDARPPAPPGGFTITGGSGGGTTEIWR